MSDRGRVRRATPARGTQVGRILATPLDSGGYPHVNFARVHTLVAEAFIGPIPPDGEVDHVDKDRANPAVENLRVYANRHEHRLANHRDKAPDRRRFDQPNEIVACECGCGRQFPRYDASERPRRFVHGHNNYARQVAA